MRLQAYLRGGGSLGQLIAEKSIAVKRHPKYPGLAQFKYSMIDSPMGDPLVQECRGVILDESNNWEVVARPFDKFFNHGEGHAKPIEWSTARVQEKLDGSLMLLYWYAGEWQVASSGLPDAGGRVNGSGVTFAGLFWNTFKACGYELPPEEMKETCFMFELMTQYNRVVVRHAMPRLVLIGARDQDGTEHKPAHIGHGMRWEWVREFPMGTMDIVIESFDDIDPLNQEGYVVVDAHFHRVKVKHPGYVAIHNMRDGMSPRRVLEVIRAGETSEILVNFPEWKPDFDAIQVKYDDLLTHLQGEYERIKGIENQKAFALECVKTRCSGALFSLRSGKVQSIKRFLADMPIDSLAKCLVIETEAPVLYSGEAA